MLRVRLFGSRVEIELNAIMFSPIQILKSFALVLSNYSTIFSTNCPTSLNSERFNLMKISPQMESFLVKVPKRKKSVVGHFLRQAVLGKKLFNLFSLLVDQFLYHGTTVIS